MGNYTIGEKIWSKKKEQKNKKRRKESLQSRDKRWDLSDKREREARMCVHVCG